MKTRINKTTLLASALGITTVGLWFFLLSPLRLSFTDIQEDITMAETQRTLLESRAGDPAARAQELMNVQEKAAKLEEYFFSDEKALDLFSQLEVLSDTTGVEMEFRLGSSLENATTLDISFTLTGSFESTMAYLSSLEHFRILFAIDELAMTEDNLGVFTTQLSTRVFLSQEVL